MTQTDRDSTIKQFLPYPLQQVEQISLTGYYEIVVKCRVSDDKGVVRVVAVAALPLLLWRSFGQLR